MALTHGELARGTAAYTAAFIGLHVLCRALSRYSPAYSRLSPPDKAYWAASMVSTVNAVAVASIALQAFVTEPGMTALADDLYATVPQLESWGSFFLGYFVADLLGNAYYWREWSGVEATTLHHAMGIIYFWQVLTGGFGHFHALCGWLLEATTPFVNLRWFLAKAGWSGTPVYKANGCVLVLGWLALRILFYGWALSQRASMQVMQLDAANAAIMYSGFAGGYLLQWFWGYKLLRGLLKALGFIGKSSTREAKAL